MFSSPNLPTNQNLCPHTLPLFHSITCGLDFGPCYLYKDFLSTGHSHQWEHLLYNILQLEKNSSPEATCSFSYHPVLFPFKEKLVKLIVHTCCLSLFSSHSLLCPLPSGFHQHSPDTVHLTLTLPALRHLQRPPPWSGPSSLFGEDHSGFSSYMSMCSSQHALLHLHLPTSVLKRSPGSNPSTFFFNFPRLLDDSSSSGASSTICKLTLMLPNVYL